MLFLNKLPISFHVILAALVYLDRIQKRVPILSSNSNALVVAAVILSIKMWEDSPLWLEDVYSFTAYSMAELRDIESKAYSLLEGKLYISEEEFSLYLSSLSSF